MKPVTVYTLRGCPFCVRLKRLLDAKHVSYEEKDVTWDGEERSRVKSVTGHPTFPQVFIGDTFVGGCDEVYQLERSGRLDPLLG
ncbi:MAG TPA: glutaredoxin domain-containing protein [Candidatus Limnocylindrales bacterium]|nr:glutaredoxin domain-containing protein [Candidatus Limnocylindrales bacterium]